MNDDVCPFTYYNEIAISSEGEFCGIDDTPCYGSCEIWNLIRKKYKKVKKA